MVGGLLLYLKRLFDIIFSLILAVLLAPFLILIALLIRLESKGSPIFAQKRVGQQSKAFSLSTNSEQCELILQMSLQMNLMTEINI